MVSFLCHCPNSLNGLNSLNPDDAKESEPKELKESEKDGDPSGTRTSMEEMLEAIRRAATDASKQHERAFASIKGTHTQIYIYIYLYAYKYVYMYLCM